MKMKKMSLLSLCLLPPVPQTVKQIYPWTIRMTNYMFNECIQVQHYYLLSGNIFGIRIISQKLVMF